MNNPFSLDAASQIGVISRAYAQRGGFTASCPTADTQFSTSTSFNPLCPLNAQNVTIGALVDRVISLILFAAGALAVIYLLYSGILYITAGGDEAKATKARTGIVNAIIGIIIIVLAFVIEKAAANVFVA